MHKTPKWSGVFRLFYIYRNKRGGIIETNDRKAVRMAMHAVRIKHCTQ